MAGKLQYIKLLGKEICGYWPGQKVVARNYALTTIDSSDYQAISTIKANILTRPGRLEGVKKGYLAANFGVIAPVCQTCQACVPLRVNTAKFSLSPSQEKLMARGSLTFNFQPTVLLDPHALYRVFSAYTANRHPEDESNMQNWGMKRFREWLDFMPYALTAHDGEGRLRGYATLEADAKSAILEYIAYDPELAKMSVGKRIWLQTMIDAKANGVEHVYVGAWAKDSPKLNYKKDHSGLETFVDGKWVDFNPETHARGPNYRAMLNREGFDI